MLIVHFQIVTNDGMRIPCIDFTVIVIQGFKIQDTPAFLLFSLGEKTATYFANHLLWYVCVRFA